MKLNPLYTAFLCAALASLGGPASNEAFALQSLSPTDLSALTSQDSVDVLVKTTAIGADFRALMPASALGAVGFDIGANLTVIKLPAEFKQILTLIGAPISSDYLMVPQASIHKGLPWGVNVGFSYLSYEENSLVGADIQKTFIRGSLTKPDVAVRASANLMRLYFLNARAYKLDVLASKKFSFLLEPYLGAGMEFTSGELNVPLSGPTGLSASVSGHSSKNAFHMYFGLPIKLLFLKITAEYDYSFAGITTYSGKFSLSI